MLFGSVEDSVESDLQRLKEILLVSLPGIAHRPVEMGWTVPLGNHWTVKTNLKNSSHSFFSSAVFFWHEKIKAEVFCQQIWSQKNWKR